MKTTTAAPRCHKCGATTLTPTSSQQMRIIKGKKRQVADVACDHCGLYAQHVEETVMPTRPPRAHPQGKPPKPRVHAPRVSSRQRGYDTKWEKARAGFLAKHPRCECPQHKGKPDAPASDTIDHIVAHKGDPKKFWDRSNWRASTRACNSRKAAAEEGGFGNRRRLPEDRVRNSLRHNDLRGA